MNPKNRQRLEQDIATTRDTLPQLWWALYSGNLEKGFEPAQALSLVQTYILGMTGNPILLVQPSSKAKGDEDEP